MVFVLGSNLTKFNRRKDGSSYRDWAVDTFEASMKMSKLEKKDIECLIIASESDFFTLQLNPASVIADDLGLFSVETMRIEGGGASGQLAVHAGVKAILSGTAKTVAVIGVDPTASQLSSENVKKLYSFSFDALIEGITGVTSTAIYALSFKLFMERTGLTDNDLADLTINNRNNAVKNPSAHLPIHHTRDDIFNSPMISSPYRRLHCSPLSDGAASIILSDEDNVPQSRRCAPKIVGIGGASDRLNLGNRDDPSSFSSKTKAMKKACSMANIRPYDIGVAEIYDAYAGAQFQAMEALGLSEKFIAGFRSGLFKSDSKLPINLSGGLIGQGSPVGATGVGQTATCAMILEGLYHNKLQMKSIPKFALADTHGGIATTSAVTILEGNKSL